MKKKPTGAEMYFKEQMRDPEFAAEYRKQRKAIEAVSGEVSFDRWFKREYGRRPSGGAWTTRATDLKRAVVEWEMRREAALKAWSASRDQKGSK